MTSTAEDTILSVYTTITITVTQGQRRLTLSYRTQQVTKPAALNQSNQRTSPTILYPLSETPDYVLENAYFSVRKGEGWYKVTAYTLSSCVLRYRYMETDSARDFSHRFVMPRLDKLTMVEWGKMDRAHLPPGMWSDRPPNKRLYRLDKDFMKPST